jgi:hypothetical protein
MTTASSAAGTPAITWLGGEILFSRTAVMVPMGVSDMNSRSPVSVSQSTTAAE